MCLSCDVEQMTTTNSNAPATIENNDQTERWQKPGALTRLTGTLDLGTVMMKVATEMEGMEMEITIRLIEGCFRVIVVERCETMLYISNCLEKYQVKYATCTLLNSALTWWNLHKRIIKVDVVFSMSWRELMKLMTKEYCPRNEIQKMETEL
ncbi:hypothetical protein Tco_1392604 [Tanacetum coccineum]